MALLSTVFRIPTKAQIGFLKLDASIRENHVRSARPSDNEIEDGATITDHVKLDPESLSMECEISNVPVSILGLGVSADDFLGAADEFLDGDKSSFEGLASNETRTPREAWEYLNDLVKKASPFSVVTALQRYENMIITNLDAPRVAENGQNLVFNIQLRKIRTVRSSTVLIPAFALEEGQTANSASESADTGKQNTRDATERETNNSSLLLQGFQKAGIL